MKQSTIKLLITASVVYIGFLILIRGFLPQDFAPSIPFLVIPVVLLLLILSNDLIGRTTVPIKPSKDKSPERLLGRKVEFLTRQVEVSSRASPSYFETVLLNHLREVLLEKVSLETGVEIDEAKQTLADRALTKSLIKDEFLLSLLYSPPPVRGKARLEMLRESIARIEAWKP